METYYHPKDLAKFGDMGKEAPELWQKFSDWYGAVFKEGALTLNLVTNLVGAFLPAPQHALEADWKRELQRRYGISFR